MKKQNQFAKVFDFMDGQLLLRKDNEYDDMKDESPYKLVVSTQFSDGELIATPSMIHGFKSEEKRDAAFTRYEEEHAKRDYPILSSVLEEFTQTIN